MNYLKLIALLCLIFPQLALSGPRDGGGATAVVCFWNPLVALKLIADFNQNMPPSMVRMIPSYFFNERNVEQATNWGAKKVEILDLIEARAMTKTTDGRPYELVDIRADESAIQYATRIVNRFEKTMPLLHKKLKEAMDKLSLDEIAGEANGITPFDDVAAIGTIDFTNCAYATLAYQEGDPDKENFLHVDSRILNLSENRFSKLDRGAMFLHEIVYKFLRMNYDITTSRTARLLVSTFLRKDLSYDDVLKAFRRANLKTNQSLLAELGERNAASNYNFAQTDQGLVTQYGLNDLFLKFNIELSELVRKVNRVESSNEIEDGLIAEILSLAHVKNLADIPEEKQDQITTAALENYNARLEAKSRPFLVNLYKRTWQTQFAQFPGLNDNLRKKLSDLIENMLANSRLAVQIASVYGSSVGYRPNEEISFFIFKVRNLPTVTGTFLTTSAFQVDPKLLAEFNSIRNQIRIPIQ